MAQGKLTPSLVRQFQQSGFDSLTNSIQVRTVLLASVGGQSYANARVCFKAHGPLPDRLRLPMDVTPCISVRPCRRCMAGSEHLQRLTLLMSCWFTTSLAVHRIALRHSAIPFGTLIGSEILQSLNINPDLPARVYSNRNPWLGDNPRLF